MNLIWDLDGTLIDSAQEVLTSLEKSCIEECLDLNRLIKPFRSGPTVDNILRESFSEDDLSHEKLENVVAAFRKNYDNSVSKKQFHFLVLRIFCMTKKLLII